MEELNRLAVEVLIGVLVILASVIGTGWAMTKKRLVNFFGRRTVVERMDENSERISWILAQLRVAFEGFNRPVMHADADGRCIYVNRSWCKLTGMAQEDALTLGWLDAIHPEDRVKVELEWKRMNGKRWFEMRFRFVRQDGIVVNAVGYATPVISDDKKLLGYVSVVDTKKEPGTVR